MPIPFPITFSVAQSLIGKYFAEGQQGAWYDPSDFSTMFQNSTGTIPVTNINQPVGLILDKSGRNNNASQSKSASRPILTQDSSGYYCLSFDGIDDGMFTSAFSMASTDKVTVVAGLRKTRDSVQEVPVEFSYSVANNGSFLLGASNGGTTKFRFSSRGTSSASAITTNTAYNAPITAVVTGLGDIGGSSAILRVNGIQVGSATTTQGTGNYGNWSLYIGRRDDSLLPFNGNLYGLIVLGASCTNDQIIEIETWMNSKTGAY